MRVKALRAPFFLFDVWDQKGEPFKPTYEPVRKSREIRRAVGLEKIANAIL